MMLKFRDEDIAALHYERYHHPHPRVRLKMEVVWLKSQELSHQQIMRLTRVSANTLRNYLRAYCAGGVERLKEVRVHRPQSGLMPYRATLETYFRMHPPANVREAMVKIEELTGIKRRPTQTRQFLKALGLWTSRIGAIPVSIRGRAG